MPGCSGSAANGLANAHRSARPRAAPPDDLSRRAGAGRWKRRLGRERCGRWRTRWRRCRRTSRRQLLLRVEEELSFRQIATILGIRGGDGPLGACSRPSGRSCSTGWGRARGAGMNCESARRELLESERPDRVGGRPPRTWMPAPTAPPCGAGCAAPRAGNVRLAADAELPRRRPPWVRADPGAPRRGGWSSCRSPGRNPDAARETGRQKVARWRSRLAASLAVVRRRLVGVAAARRTIRHPRLARRLGLRPDDLGSCVHSPSTEARDRVEPPDRSWSEEWIADVPKADEEPGSTNWRRISSGSCARICRRRRGMWCPRTAPRRLGKVSAAVATGGERSVAAGAGRRGEFAVATAASPPRSRDGQRRVREMSEVRA